jgi:hypothetical protein
MSRTRRSDQPTLTIISWRDIPAQVVAKHGDRTVKSELSQRFQVAIDRAAMYAGLFETDDYLTEWRRQSGPCDEDLDLAVSAEVDRLETEFPSQTLSELAGNGGFLIPPNEASEERADQ